MRTLLLLAILAAQTHAVVIIDDLRHRTEINVDGRPVALSISNANPATMVHDLDLFGGTWTIRPWSTEVPGRSIRVEVPIDSGQVRRCDMMTCTVGEDPTTAMVDLYFLTHSHALDTDSVATLDSVNERVGIYQRPFATAGAVPVVIRYQINEGPVQTATDVARSYGFNASRINLVRDTNGDVTEYIPQVRSTSANKARIDVLGRTIEVQYQSHVASVPEPHQWAMLGILGLLLIGWRRWRSHTT